MAERGSRQVFPASGSTLAPQTSLHHPASKARGRKCPGLGRAFPKAWQLCWEITREPLPGLLLAPFISLMTPLICSFYLCQWQSDWGSWRQFGKHDQHNFLERKTKNLMKMHAVAQGSLLFVACAIKAGATQVCSLAGAGSSSCEA